MPQGDASIFTIRPTNSQHVKPAVVVINFATTETTKKCANCQGNHASNFKGCKAHQQAATARRKAQDEISVVKLTLTLISCIKDCMADDTGIECNTGDICKIVTNHVDRFYNVTLDNRVLQEEPVVNQPTTTRATKPINSTDHEEHSPLEMVSTATRNSWSHI